MIINIHKTQKELLPRTTCVYCGSNADIELNNECVSGHVCSSCSYKHELNKKIFEPLLTQQQVTSADIADVQRQLAAISNDPNLTITCIHNFEYKPVIRENMLDMARRSIQQKEDEKVFEALYQCLGIHYYANI